MTIEPIPRMILSHSPPTPPTLTCSPPLCGRPGCLKGCGNLRRGTSHPQRGDPGIRLLLNQGRSQELKLGQAQQHGDRAGSGRNVSQELPKSAAAVLPLLGLKLKRHICHPEPDKHRRSGGRDPLGLELPELALESRLVPGTCCSSNTSNAIGKGHTLWQMRTGSHAQSEWPRPPGN